MQAISSQFSLTLNNEHQIEMWNELNNEYLPNGLEKELTIEFLEKINSLLRDGDTDRPKGIRKPHTPDVFDSDRDLYFTPSNIVPEGMQEFLEWFNKEMKLCDDNKANPLVFANAVHQRFMSNSSFS